MKGQVSQQYGALVRLAAALLLIAGLTLLAVALHADRARYRNVDFIEYYSWALQLRLGSDPWRPASAHSGVSVTSVDLIGHCNYTPAFLQLFAPLTRFPQPAAFWLWQSIQVGSLLAAIVLMMKELWPPANTAWYLAALGGALLFPHVYGTLYTSQPTCLLLMLMVASWSAERRGHPAPAGLLLAAAVLLKFYPAVLGGYYLFRRRWLMVIWTSVWVIIGVIAFGPVRHLEFLTQGAPVFNSPFWLTQDRAVAILGNVYTLLARRWDDPLGPIRRILLWLFTVGIDLALVTAAAWSLRNVGAGRNEVEAQGIAAGLWMLTAVLVSPLAWAHELVLGLPLYLFALVAFFRSRRHAPIAFSLIFVGLILVCAAYFSGALRQLHFYFVGTLATYAGGCALLMSWPAAGQARVAAIDRPAPSASAAGA